MTTKIDVDQLSSSGGKDPLSDVGDGDSRSRAGDNKPTTSSNTPLYVTVLMVCLLGFCTLSIYQVHKLEARVHRLEADFVARCSIQPVVDGSDPMTSSTANSSTPPNNEISSPSPLLWLPHSQRPSAGGNKYPHRRGGNTGSGVAVDDFDAEEDGSSDLHFDFDDAHVIETSAPDDVIDGSGDEPLASDAAERRNVSRPSADPESPDDEYDIFTLADETENLMDAVALLEDRQNRLLDDLMFGDRDEDYKFGLLGTPPTDDIGIGKPRPRRSVDEMPVDDKLAEVDRMMADDASLDRAAEHTNGGNIRHRHRIGGSQPARRDEPARAVGDGSRSRPSSRQRELQQPASSDDVATSADTMRTNEQLGAGTTDQEAARRSRTRQENSRTQPTVKDAKKKSRHSGSSSVMGAAQTPGIKVAHFVAPRDSNHYVSDSDPPATFPFWKVDNWTSALDSQNLFYELRDGMVTVTESGVYMVYAQMMYHDTSGRWAFGIYVDNNERIKCMNSEQLNRQHGTDIFTGGSGSDVVHSVYQHCYTSGLLRLRRYDKVSLRCLYGSKSIMLQPSFTFWGLIKLVSLAD